MGRIFRIALVTVFILGSASLRAQWSTSGGNTTTNDHIGINTATPAADFASAAILDRMDGKIASFGAGGTSVTFAYDATGVFKIESSSGEPACAFWIGRSLLRQQHEIRAGRDQRPPIPSDRNDHRETAPAAAFERGCS